MDSFEMNKILGAILGTALVVVALNIASGAIFAPEMPAKPGYNIVVPKAATGTQEQEPADEPVHTTPEDEHGAEHSVEQTGRGGPAAGSLSTGDEAREAELT